MRCWGGKDQIATIFPCDYKNPIFPDFRLGREHLLSTAEELVFFPEYKNISERWELCSGTDALNAWLNKNKIIAIPSDAGRATEQIIKTLDGFWGVGKIANSGTVKLLNDMSRKPLTRSVHFAEFRQKIKDAAGKDIWRYKEFETLVERNVVELGLDSALQYALGKNRLNHADFNAATPYNLYKNRGLPPTPISNPSLKAIQYASDAPKGNLLYFLSSDGSTFFFTNYKKEKEWIKIHKKKE